MVKSIRGKALDAIAPITLAVVAEIVRPVGMASAVVVVCEYARKVREAIRIEDFD